ncbi:MAG: hypothetical protein ABIZ70_00830 [Gemmatimonadales bacterium]
MTRRTLSGALIVLWLAGCGGTIPMPNPAPATFPAENVIQFAWEGKNVRLTRVATTADSVSGIPIGARSGCAPECRVSYPRSVLTGATRWAKAGGESRTIMSTIMLVPVVLGVAAAIVFAGYKD